jgi:hypothetical protein
MEDFLTNYGPWIVGAFAIGRVITDLTPTETDNKWLQKLRAVGKALGLQIYDNPGQPKQ